MLSKRDLEYLIQVLTPMDQFWNPEIRAMLPKLRELVKTAPNLSETIEVSHCDGSRLIQRTTKRPGLK